MTVFAAGQTYTLGDTGVRIDVPSDYNDPSLSAYGLNKAELLEYMEANDTYLDALCEQWNFDMVVTITDSPLDGVLYSGEEAAFQDIVNSVQLARASSDEERAPAASAFVYRDTETGGGVYVACELEPG